MTIWRTHTSGWIPKATDTLNIENIAFSLQNWLHENAPLLCYTPIVSLVYFRSNQFRYTTSYFQEQYKQKLIIILAIVYSRISKLLGVFLLPLLYLLGTVVGHCTLDNQNFFTNGPA
jgi:hypothetical protein